MPWVQALYEELQQGSQQVFYKQTMQGRLQHALIQIKVGVQSLTETCCSGAVGVAHLLCLACRAMQCKAARYCIQ
jgi:hypothetical protein